MKVSQNQKKIFSNIIWSFGGKIVNMASALLVGILVARYLGPENYGLMNYVISYVAIFTVLSNFGLDNIEIRELSRQNDQKDKILGTCFIIRLVCSLIAYLIIVISLFLYKTDSFTTVMILVYALSMFTNTGNIFRNYFTSIVENKFIVKTEISRTVIGAIVKIVLLCVKAPVEYFIFAQLFVIL